MNGIARILVFGWLTTPFGLVWAADPLAARGDDIGNDGDQASSAPAEPEVRVVRNPFDVEATILQVLPEGRKVRQGDRICQIDVSAYWEQLEAQMERTAEAYMDYEDAKVTLEVAEINLAEYQLGLFPQELKQAEGEIKLAQADHNRARDRAVWARRQHEIGLASRLEVLEAELERLQSELVLKKAEQARYELLEHRRNQQVRLLEADILRARRDLRARRERYETLKQEEKDLRKKIERGMLYASTDGVIRHRGELARGTTIPPEAPILEIAPAEPDESDKESDTTESGDTTSEAGATNE